MRSRIGTKFFLKGLLKTPSLFFPFLKGEYYKHVKVDGDYSRTDGKVARPPFQISIRITNACNQHCAICGQHGKNGYMRGGKGKELLTTVPYNKYKEMVTQLLDYKPIYYFTGGEPFLYPDLVKLVNYIKQSGSIATVVTNGVKLKEFAKEIVDNNWDMVLVSLDGPEHIHDACRGLEGAYQTMVEGLKQLRAYKDARGRSKPLIFVSLTLSKINIDYLEETFELIKGISPDFLVVYLSWFTSESIGQEQSKILKEELGTEAFTWRSYVNTFTLRDAERFSENLNAVRRKRWPFDYKIIPDLSADDIRNYYLYPEKTFGYKKCSAPFMMMDIMPNGDVMTCRDFIDVKVGNINEANTLDIWNSEKMVKFRKLLIKHNGLLPQCSRCCGLMGF